MCVREHAASATRAWGRTVLAAAAAYCISAVAPSAYAGDGTVTLLHLGDLHGHMVPRPNMREGEETKGDVKVGGLAYVYGAISKIRAANPGTTLLINTGDTIQGSAEALFTRGQAMIDILNLFKIDAFAPGNWDYVYGTDRFLELFAGANAKANWPTLAANLYYSTLDDYPESPYAAKSGQRILAPYLVKQVGAVKVGIIGLTSDRGPQAVSTRVTDGFTLTPGEEELRTLVPLLRKQENVDLVVLISERGLGPNRLLTEQVPGIDVVLSSDMHEETRRVLVGGHGAVLVEEGQDGTMMGELRVTVRHKKMVRYTWIAHQITTQNTRPDPVIAEKIAQIRAEYIKGPDFRAHLNPINGAVLRTPIDTVVGYTKKALHRSNFADSTEMPAVIEGSSHDFLADAFKFACNSEIGVIRGFRYGTHVAPGPVRLEDLYHFMPIGPQIACGMISGDQITRQIEASAEGSLSRWVDAWSGGWVYAYAGVTFTLDPSKAKENRITDIRVNGEPIDRERMYHVAGYWYADNPDRINRTLAFRVRVLKSPDGSIVDGTDVAAYYLKSQPGQTVDTQINRIKLLHPLPRRIGLSREIQPLAGYPMPDY